MLTQLHIWRLQRAQRHVEALALMQRSGTKARLRSLFALELYTAFLDEVGDAPGWTAQRGLARLALGQIEAAADDLAAAASSSSQFGLWLRAAAALATTDALRARALLATREKESAAGLLAAHLAARMGDDAEARRILPGLNLKGRWAVECDLLRANLGDASGAVRALERDEPAMAENGPLVSVIVAAYNAEPTIAASLRSLTEQSWRDLEIIVVDDASGDGTTAIAERFAGVRVLRQTVNAGAYVARNAGVAAARGDFIAFHDADDVARPERIARQMAPLLADPDLAFTIARWVRRDAAGMFRARQIVPLIRQHTGSMLIRREFLDAVGAFDPVRFGADGDMLLRLKVAAGPRRWRAIDQVLTIGGFDAASAVHGAETGYGARGYSLSRQAYREARTWALVERLAHRG